MLASPCCSQHVFLSGTVLLSFWHCHRFVIYLKHQFQLAIWIFFKPQYSLCVPYHPRPLLILHGSECGSSYGVSGLTCLPLQSLHMCILLQKLYNMAIFEPFNLCNALVGGKGQEMVFIFVHCYWVTYFLSQQQTSNIINSPHICTHTHIQACGHLHQDTLPIKSKVICLKLT